MNPNGSVSEKSTSATSPLKNERGQFTKVDPSSSLITPTITYKKTANQRDPLVNFQLNNPIPPIKRLLKKLFSNEEITIKIPILTAIALVAFGLGGASGFLTAIKIELANRIPIVGAVFPTPTPSSTPVTWVLQTLFGTFSKQSGENFYLIKQNGDVVRIKVPNSINSEKIINRKILVTGKYYLDTNELYVTEASDLLQIDGATPAPTTTPTIAPISTQEPTPTPELTPTTEPTN